VRNTSGDINGVGVDIVSIERCREKLERHPSMYEGVCAPGETAPRNIAAFARRWAVKEAVAKSCGERLTPRQILVTHSDDGAPLVVAHGYENDRFEVSVTDDAGVAVAIAVRLRPASA
jgi:phosphopantetheine--protein transferase-like protein